MTLPLGTADEPAAVFVPIAPDDRAWRDAVRS